ncbi:MAG: transcriptional regulator [Candidatus Hodarchaeales archaeon]|jgi:DNA-binding MarR family transcriptional regulator
MIHVNATTEREKDLKTILELDDVVHSPVRLAILIFLLPLGEITFTTILKTLDLTGGNLASHLKKLEQANLVKVHKKFVDARPTTIVLLTDKGRTAVTEYASSLSIALKNMLESSRE